MRKAELVLVPAPGISHVVSATEFAKCLTDRDDHLSITILVIRQPGASDVQSSTPAPDTRIRCINIPPPAELPSLSKSFDAFMSDYIESHKPDVEHAILTEILSEDSVQLAGIVVDFFCTSMIDVAQQFNVPSYLFFTSGAAFLGFMLYLPVRHNQVGARFDPCEKEYSIISSYANPVPTNVIPSLAFDKDAYTSFLYHGTQFSKAKGFIINTLAELEPHAIHSMTMGLPPVYPVGPLLDLNVKDNSTGLRSKWDEIISWLDEQPLSSVVFLCFGSRGSFEAPQLEQIAIALEGSTQRFLWSIRRPPPKETLQSPTEYENVQEVLPEGFLKRTNKQGMVCGWAPQVKVLAHPAIGGFVSHCGWNSTLESLWHGVPIATWPLYAEQQINAFQLVGELGLAVDLKMEYRLGTGELVTADVIERAIKSLMDVDNPVRNRVKKMSEKSRKAVLDGGSSYDSVGRLIEDLLKNIAAAVDN